jgi:hypothetical protein
MEDITVENSYHLRELFGDDAFYNTVGEVLKEYLRQTGTETGTLSTEA